MNILITGGVGFIGTNTAAYFGKSQKNKITIVDDFSRNGVEKNAAHLSKNFKNIKIVRSDVRNIGNFLSDLKKSDLIIHLAGQTAVTTSIKKPLLDFRSNLEGGFMLLEAVRKNNPSAVTIYSSTNKVYGDLSRHKLKKNKQIKRYENLIFPRGVTESEKLDFISPYGCSKGAVDLYFIDYYRIFSLNTVVFRQSCIYGPHQIGVEDQGWVAHFAKQFLFKKPITIFGDGYQVRDLLYVDDLIKGYEKAAKNIGKVKGQAFNLGGGIKNAYSLLNVIEVLERKFGYSVKVDFSLSRAGDQKYFVSANDRIRKSLGWAPVTDLERGLDKLIAWQKINL